MSAFATTDKPILILNFVRDIPILDWILDILQHCNQQKIVRIVATLQELEQEESQLNFNVILFAHGQDQGYFNNKTFYKRLNDLFFIE